MTAPLTVHNAQISTASIEIKTLTISKKQVTLAVFRQLIEEPLIGDDGTLNGVAWGTVNYHPDKPCTAPLNTGECRGYSTAHFHVVWQKGEELRRSTVAPGIEFIYHNGPAFDLFYSTCIAAWLHGELDSRWFGGNPVRRDKGYGNPISRSWHGTHQRLGSRATMSASAFAAMEASEALANADAEWVSVTAEQLTERQSEFAATLSALGAEVGSPEYQQLIADRWADAVAEADEEQARRQRHHDIRQTLAGLPQLFIAV